MSPRFLPLALASLLVAPLALAQPSPESTPEEVAAAVTEAAPTPAEAVRSKVDVKRHGSSDEDVAITGRGGRTVFAAGDTVEMTAVAPDAFLAGQAVILKGEVLDNFGAAGQTVSVKGPVGGDAFLLGDNIRIDADVSGDVYAAGESLEIPLGVTVGGNVYFGGADLDIDGAVGGSLLAGVANVSIDGSVGGDVQLEAGDLRVGDGASIGGDLTYTAPNEGDVAPGAKLGGDVDWTKRVPKESASSDDGGWDFGRALGWRMFLLFGSLIVGGALLGLFPRLLSVPAAVLEEEAPVSLGVGFAVLLGVPVLAVFLMLFIVPIPLSLLALSLWVPAMFLGRLVAAYAFGMFALERMGQAAKPLGALAVGIVSLQFVYAVPFLGGFAALIATVLGLGALFLAARRAGQAQAA